MEQENFYENVFQSKTTAKIDRFGSAKLAKTLMV